jgi:glutaredoxin-like protein NrdH
MDIKVYTKYNCVQDKAGVEYETINVEDNEEAKQMLLDVGYKSMPVVIAPGHAWAGFKHENLKQLAQEYNIEKNKAS